MRRLKSPSSSAVAAAIVGAVGVVDQSGRRAEQRGKKTCTSSACTRPRASHRRRPELRRRREDGRDRPEKKGWTVKYERIPASATIASSQEQAFLQAQQKTPDFWIGLTSSNVFIPVGPKVAATDLPSFALSSPTEGVKNGPSGGDNIFLLASAQRADVREAGRVRVHGSQEALKLKAEARAQPRADVVRADGRERGEP